MRVARSGRGVGVVVGSRARGWFALWVAGGALDGSTMLIKQYSVRS